MDIISRLYSPFIFFKGIESTTTLKLRGRPIVYKHQLATIKLADYVTLNSRPNRYHGYMHSPVKLLADAPNALIEIGDETRINGACIHSKSKIIIGKRCLIAAGAQIFDSNGHILSLQNPRKRINIVDKGTEVVIGDDVWIGVNAIILPGTVIGSGSIVGANAVVSGQIPERSIVKSSVSVSPFNFSE